MKIRATSLVIGAGIALTSDDQLITVMLRPGEVHTVSDQMRHAKSIRHAIQLGYITVDMDGTISDDYTQTHSDFVAQVELAELAALVSGISGTFGSGFSGGGSSSGVNGTKFMFLDIHGGQDTALIDDVTGTPSLVFRDNKDDRSAWTVTVPDDYVSGTNVIVRVFWSPRTTGAGNIRWLLEYKSVTSGSSVATPLLTSTFVQPSPGTAGSLTDTGTALTIPSGSVTANALLTLSIRREGKDASDTYGGSGHVHLVRVEYTGKRFS